MVDPEELPKCIPIAWVNCLLITHDHELRSGALSLRMWRDEKANPIGTCVQNSSSSAPILHVGFDEYQLPVVFPTKDETELLNDPGVSAILQPDPAQAELIHNLISKYPLYPLTKEERSMLWKFRRYCAGFPKSLPKLLLSVPYNSRACVQELHRLLQAWPMLPPIDAMELLDSRYADSKVRQYGVKCVAQFSDGELQSYLLQFVQVLKYEPYHDSALARFLMKRALRSRRIGHVFFWFLKAEVHVPEIAQRYGLMLEAYLHGCGSYLHELMKQNEILSSLQTIATKIKTVPLNVRRAVLLDELKHVQLPRKFQLPIDPSWEATSFVYEKCKFMDSKKLPLWLEMENADPHGKPLVFIFKCGDDLRQDMLTLQIIRFMDKVRSVYTIANLMNSIYDFLRLSFRCGKVRVLIC
jgi:phosphatidylinositol-4,5-bisphosphate 3-kinase